MLPIQCSNKFSTPPYWRPPLDGYTANVSPWICHIIWVNRIHPVAPGTKFWIMGILKLILGSSNLWMLRAHLCLNPTPLPTTRNQFSVNHRKLWSISLLFQKGKKQLHRTRHLQQREKHFPLSTLFMRKTIHTKTCPKSKSEPKETFLRP